MRGTATMLRIAMPASVAMWSARTRFRDLVWSGSFGRTVRGGSDSEVVTYVESDSMILATALSECSGRHGVAVGSPVAEAVGERVFCEHVGVVGRVGIHGREDRDPRRA